MLQYITVWPQPPIILSLSVPYSWLQRLSNFIRTSNPLSFHSTAWNCSYKSTVNLFSHNSDLNSYLFLNSLEYALRLSSQQWLCLYFTEKSSCSIKVPLSTPLIECLGLRSFPSFLLWAERLSSFLFKITPFWVIWLLPPSSRTRFYQSISTLLFSVSPPLLNPVHSDYVRLDLHYCTSFLSPAFYIHFLDLPHCSQIDVSLNLNLN